MIGDDTVQHIRLIKFIGQGTQTIKEGREKDKKKERKSTNVVFMRRNRKGEKKYVQKRKQSISSHLFARTKTKYSAFWNSNIISS